MTQAGCVNALSTSSKVTVRMDKELKEQLEATLNNLGLNLTSGINVFAKAAVRHGGLPFTLADPFFGRENAARLKHSMTQAAAGEIIYKTGQELGLDADDE